MLEQLLSAAYVPGEPRKLVLWDRQVTHTRKKLQEDANGVLLNDHFYTAYLDDMSGAGLRPSRFGFWSTVDLNYTNSAEKVTVQSLNAVITGFGDRYLYNLRRAEPGEFGAKHVPYVAKTTLGALTKREVFRSRESLPSHCAVEIGGRYASRYLLQADYSDGSAVLMQTGGKSCSFVLDKHVTDLRLRIRNTFANDSFELFRALDLVLEWVQYCQDRSESDLKRFDLAEHLVKEIISIRRVLDLRDICRKENGYVQEHQ